MKTKLSTTKAGRLLADHDWRTEFESHDDPVDFLVRFLDLALDSLAVAATDPNLRPEQRTAAAYSCSHAVRRGAKIATTALKGNKHQALPDVGLQEAIADAVDAFHAIALADPSSLKNVPFFSRLPINVAADGKPFENCVDLLANLPKKLGSTSTGFTPAPSRKRAPAVGGKWNALALKMRTRSPLAQTPLQPPRGKNSNLWEEWQAVELALENDQSNILESSVIKRWRNGPRLIKMPDTWVWAELKKEVRRALENLAKHNHLANSPNSPDG